MGDIVIPSRRDRAISSTVTALAAIGLYIVTSMLLGLLTVFVFARDSFAIASGARAGGGDLMRQAAQSADARIPAWASIGVLVVSALVAWLGASRAGRGMVGDPVASIKAVDAAGERVTRGRTLLRAGVPVLIAAIGISLGLGPTVLFVMIVCAAVAAYREDRRGPFELLAKVHLTSTDAVKVDRETRRAQLRATKAESTTEA